MKDYCRRYIPNYGTVLGYDCNTFKILQDTIELNGGREKFSKYNALAVLAKGMGTVGISTIAISAHGAHHQTYNSQGKPPYGVLLHEVFHKLNLQHNAKFRAREGCDYPKNIKNIRENCTWDRYGGSTLMGGGGKTLSPHADELRRLGVLENNEIFKTAPSSNTKEVTLVPVNSKREGLKQIQISGTGDGWYPNTYLSVEFRRNSGIDFRDNEEDRIIFNLRADLQNNGTRDAMAFELPITLTTSNNMAKFPEWGFNVILSSISKYSATIIVDYLSVG